METKSTIKYDDFAKLDLRVATITQAELHPNADRLLKLQVDLGSEQRQVCAGIKDFYDPTDLVGKQIIVVANLAPRKIRGEESNGMLLAASVMGPNPDAPDVTPGAADGEQAEGEPSTPVPTEILTDVVVLSPSKPVPAGSSVG